MPGVSAGFFDLEALGNWQTLAADVTFYYRWQPDVAWNMTKDRLQWWSKQAVRINKVQAGDNG
ncbi:hypothetical protein CUU54_02655 [Pectobacterium polaris]|nr:hypothetical protein [Pectobacterium polaris]PWD57072.1 hypothetical protein DF209_15650 [Pectobacterium polaris]